MADPAEVQEGTAKPVNTAVCQGLVSPGLAPESLFVWFSVEDVLDIRASQPANLRLIVQQVRLIEHTLNPPLCVE